MIGGFARFKDLTDAELAGAVRDSTWRKTPSQVTASGILFDLSMSPGNPSPQYYVGAELTTTPLSQSANGGIYHGGNVAPAKKFLRRSMVLTAAAAATPLAMTLCDYLMFYPFIVEDTTDEQALVNTIALPRYPDGAGVQMMAIVVAGQTGGQTFRVRYTNSDGVSDRISGTVTCNTQVSSGTILTSATATNGAAGPFIPLQSGDTGVRSIEGVTMVSGTDVGLFTLVLVRPLANLNLRGIDAPVEVDYLRDFSVLPEIKDDAYLNFICCPMGSLSGAALHGFITFTWN